ASHFSTCRRVRLSRSVASPGRRNRLYHSIGFTIGLTIAQKPAAAEGPALLDDSTDEEEAGAEGAAAPKRPRKLTDRAKQGCFLCGITLSSKYYHCANVSFAGNMPGAGPVDVICMDCYK